MKMTRACTCLPAADVSRKYIKDPELLRFIDLECYIWSTVSADLTPMMNAGMVCYFNSNLLQRAWYQMTQLIF